MSIRKALTDAELDVVRHKYKHEHAPSMSTFDILITQAQEANKLLAFKTFVHKYLDDAGVPIEPDSPHTAAGCRIGGRLEWMVKRVAELEAENKQLHEVANDVVGDARKYSEMLAGDPEHAARIIAETDSRVRDLKAEVGRLQEALKLAKTTLIFNRVWTEGSEGQRVIDTALAPSAPATNASDPWAQYRASGCQCQVEDAAGYPTIVLHSTECPIDKHRALAAQENPD